MSASTFDEKKYLEANPDVAVAVREGEFKDGYDHYTKYGKKEGRVFGNFQRKNKIFFLLNEKGVGLEIGPSHNPIAPKRLGYNVQIIDHATASELRNKYQNHGVNLSNIEDVDFVWRGEPLSELIGKTESYDWIIASHVIEHVPDLCSYLQQCEALLKTDGILSLVIPDKRYCFDFFNSTNTTGDILDAYAEKRVRPSHGQVFDHFANASKLNGQIAWAAEGKADSLVHTFSDAETHWIQSLNADEYIDVHCWRFTPASFRLIVQDLASLGLINLEIKAEFDTEGCEFYMSLGKKKGITERQSRFLLLQEQKAENV